MGAAVRVRMAIAKMASLDADVDVGVGGQIPHELIALSESTIDSGSRDPVEGKLGRTSEPRHGCVLSVFNPSTTLGLGREFGKVWCVAHSEYTVHSHTLRSPLQ